MNSYELTLTTAPAEEPVTLTEAKAHLRVDHTDEDTLIGSLITAARQFVEKEIDRQLITATYTVRFDGFPCVTRWNEWGEIRLPKPPLISVTSVSYVDANGDSQTVATSDYTVFKPTKQQGAIRLNYNVSWPVVRSQPGAVTVVYVAGYGAAAAVPTVLKQSMLLLIGHLYEHKSLEDIPASVRFLLDTENWGAAF